jgi:hypothetical protein
MLHNKTSTDTKKWKAILSSSLHTIFFLILMPKYQLSSNKISPFCTQPTYISVDSKTRFRSWQIQIIKIKIQIQTIQINSNKSSISNK